MKNIALLLATMCIFAQATSVFENPSFLELKKNPFGSALTSLIEMSMKVPSGSLDAIADALNSIEDILQSRITNNNLEIQRSRGWCSEQEDDLTTQINSAQGDDDSYHTEQSNLEQEQSDDQDKLQNERSDLAENQENQTNTEQALQNENDRYASAVADYSEAIAACNQALQLLGTLQVNPTGFLQSKARFGNVVALLEKHLADKSSPLIQPVLSVLTELANASADVDQNQLSKIVSLIQQLLQELLNQQADNEVKHATAVENLNDSLANLATLISNSEDAIDKYTARLDQISQRLESLQGLISGVENLLATLQNQLAVTEDTCAGYESSFITNNSELNAQAATLEKVKQYFLNQIVPSVQAIDDSSYEDTLTVQV